MILAGLGYGSIGIITAELAKSAHSAKMGGVWRLAAWVLSLAVYLAHLAYERRDSTRSITSSAGYVAAGVAIGAFAVAALGPVRAYWGTSRFWQVTLLSLILWPVITGVPAFLVAAALGFIHRSKIVRRTAGKEARDG